MKRLITVFVLLAVMAGSMALATGCKSSSGSRDYIPGKGWVPND